MFCLKVGGPASLVSYFMQRNCILKKASVSAWHTTNVPAFTPPMFQASPHLTCILFHAASAQLKAGRRHRGSGSINLHNSIE